jgi:surface antigen Omp85-like protein/WD40 repeat protein
MVLLAGGAEAAAPRLRWRALETARFVFEYHEGEEALVHRLVPIGERAFDELSVLFSSIPETPIHVVVTDETDSANGFTQVLPRNVITLFPVEPESFGTLGDYDDFMKLLFVHELTHVFHLDSIGGIATWFNDLFGKQMAPNQIQPRWFIEGIAVYAESKLTRGGRVRSAIVDMTIREQILEDRFPDLDQISTFTRRYPGGNFAYILGGRFLDWIARTHGEGALAKITEEYGARIIPYGLNLVAEHATGRTFVELWDDWRKDEERRTLERLERIQAEGLVVGRRVARDTTEIYHPRYSRRGDLAFVDSPRYDDTNIIVLGPDGKERRRLRTSRGVGAFTPDGARFVAAIVDTYLEKFSFTDLEVIDLSTGERRRRTFGARADEPDVSPDGKTIVAVQRAAGRSWLSTLSVDGEDPPRAFFEVEEGADVNAPRWSPDGTKVVCSIHLPGEGRRIAIVDARTKARRFLTRTGAQDLNPIWTAEGGRVLFSSDRGGVFNVWSVSAEGGALSRLTNVETGAFEPALDPGGRTLAFLHGSIDGYDLNTLSLDEAPIPLKVDLSTSTSTGTSSWTSTTSSARAEAAAIPTADRPYSPWPTLLPRAWLPTTGVDGVGDTYGVFFAGADVTEAHTYQARLEYGTTSKRLGYSISYSNHTLYTPFSISSSLIATTRPGGYLPVHPGGDRLESIFRTRASISLPVDRWDSNQSFFLSYGFELRRGITLVSRDPMQEAPEVLGDLDLASLVVGWSFSNVRAHADSISAARGQSLDIAIEVNDPRLGSDLRVLSVTAHHRAYLTLPWLKHHVLATRIAFGGAAGDSGGRAVYALGGLSVRDILRDVVDNIGVGADVIRGYPIYAFRGNAFYLGTIEYRWPIVDFERGVDTIPLFIDRIYAALFADAGDTPIERLDLGGLKVGTGAELRLDLALGYYFPFTARFGYGRGLMSGGTDDFYLVLGGLF